MLRERWWAVAGSRETGDGRRETGGDEKETEYLRKNIEKYFRFFKLIKQ